MMPLAEDNMKKAIILIVLTVAVVADVPTDNGLCRSMRTRKSFSSSASTPPRNDHPTAPRDSRKVACVEIHKPES